MSRRFEMEMDESRAVNFGENEFMNENEDESDQAEV